MKKTVSILLLLILLLTFTACQGKVQYWTEGNFAGVPMYQGEGTVGEERVNSKDPALSSRTIHGVKKADYDSYITLLINEGFEEIDLETIMFYENEKTRIGVLYDEDAEYLGLSARQLGNHDA